MTPYFVAQRPITRQNKHEQKTGKTSYGSDRHQAVIHDLGIPSTPKSNSRHCQLQLRSPHLLNTSGCNKTKPQGPRETLLRDQQGHVGMVSWLLHLHFASADSSICWIFANKCCEIGKWLLVRTFHQNSVDTLPHIGFTRGRSHAFAQENGMSSTGFLTSFSVN